MSQKTLHVCNLDKFIPPFIDFVEKKFGLNDHFFWLIGDHERCPVKQNRSNYKVKTSIVGQIQGLLTLAYLMNKSDKIILHGLFNPRITSLLFLMPWVLKKCYWIMWGGDLYDYQLGEKNWKWELREFLRRPVFKKIAFLVTGTPGDVALARKWYGARGKHIICFNYTSNIYQPLPHVVNDSDCINIMTGNSANPSNNHFAIFDKLKRLVDDNCMIYCPLSYGDQKYAEEVCREGERLFGRKFKPIREFIVFDDYMKFLTTIDIAIFDHHRQQAFGNTLSLLGFGKKVYINPVSTLNGVFKQYSIKVYDSTSINLTPIESKVALSNKCNVEKNFSEENLVESLRKWIG